MYGGDPATQRAIEQLAAQQAKLFQDAHRVTTGQVYQPAPAQARPSLQDTVQTMIEGTRAEIDNLAYNLSQLENLLAKLESDPTFGPALELAMKLGGGK